MTRLKPPSRKVPPMVADQANKAKRSSSNTGSNKNNSNGKLQVILIMVMTVCMGLTVYVNVTSTSSTAMDMIHYRAAVNQAIEDFKQGALSSGSSSRKSTSLSSSSSANTKARPALGDSQIAKLSCEPHGGPSNELAKEMIYWEDIPSDAEFVSPFRQKRGEHRRYMTFEPDGGGWNNIRMAMETVVGLAAAMGRTLVLPPQKQMYLLGKGDNKQKRHFGFEDFFPMQQMAQENAAIEMITMQEFLELEAMTGNLKDRTTGKTSFPPYNRTNWNGLKGVEYDELREWLRTVTLVPQWNPDKCLAAFPANGDHSSIEELVQMQKTIHQEGIKTETYIGNPVPVDGPPIDRMKENLNGRRELCVYDEAMEKEMVVHFACAHKLGLRLLVHFYEFLYMEDWKEDLWMKRFMRDHMRYNDDIQCAAARLVSSMREIARKNDPTGNPDGLYDSFHIRRGDFQYKNTRIPADEILVNTRQYLIPNTTIFIATDERDKSFFAPMRRYYNIYFLDDFMDHLKGVNTNYYGMIDQLVASRGRIFFGCWFSTFTGFINRMRGYRSVKDKLPGYEQGVLPTSYYYVPTNRLKVLHEYTPLSGSHFAREFPTSWRNIDKSVGLLPQSIE